MDLENRTRKINSDNRSYRKQFASREREREVHAELAWLASVRLLPHSNQVGKKDNDKNSIIRQTSAFDCYFLLLFFFLGFSVSVFFYVSN